MQFVTGKESAATVTLKQDGRDVNVLINGVIVLYFEGGTGQVQMTHATPEEWMILRKAGVQVSDNQVVINR